MTNRAIKKIVVENFKSYVKEKTGKRLIQKDVIVVSKSPRYNRFGEGSSVAFISPTKSDVLIFYNNVGEVEAKIVRSVPVEGIKGKPLAQ